MASMVQVYECAEGVRRPTHRVPVGKFLHAAIGRLPPLEIVQLRKDLTVLGRSRIDGTAGRWHEYVLVEG